jgi:hypothetical protein
MLGTFGLFRRPEDSSRAQCPTLSYDGFAEQEILFYLLDELLARTARC